MAQLRSIRVRFSCLFTRSGHQQIFCLTNDTCKMILLALLIADFLMFGCLAAPFTQNHVVHERRNTYPAGWTRRGELDNRAILPMRIALSQSNLDKGHEWLMRVSHPGSEKYGRHWSAKEVAQAFAPRYSATPNETGGTLY
jgi:hypothetical protein